MPDAMHTASGFDRIEVVTGVERRRRWSLGEKLKAVEETRSSGMSVSYVARKYGIAPSLLFRWRKLVSEGGKEAIRCDDAVVSAAEVRELKKRIRELERVLGKKTLENEILTEAVKLANGFAPCLTGSWTPWASLPSIINASIGSCARMGCC